MNMSRYIVYFGLLFLIFSCKNPESHLVGTWKDTTDGGVWIFNDDGNTIFNWKGKNSEYRWKIIGDNMLKIGIDGFVIEYEIKGNYLYFKRSNGHELPPKVLKKQ